MAQEREPGEIFEHEGQAGLENQAQGENENQLNGGADHRNIQPNPPEPTLEEGQGENNEAAQEPILRNEPVAQNNGANRSLNGGNGRAVHENEQNRQQGSRPPAADGGRQASVSGPHRGAPAQGPGVFPQGFPQAFPQLFPPNFAQTFPQGFPQYFQPQFSAPKAVVLPKIEMPHFKGEKGTTAEVWLAHLLRYQRFYGLSDGQMVELARISCKGDYASVWASMLDDTISFADFLAMFRSEFVAENEEKLKRELMDLKCTKSIGEYATEVLRLVKALQVPMTKQVREFSKGLPLGFRHLIDGRDPQSIVEAIQIAKEEERKYEDAGKDPFGNVVNDLSKKMQKKVEDGLQAGLQRMQALFMSGVAARGMPTPTGGPSANFLTAANAVPLGGNLNSAAKAAKNGNNSRPKGQGNGRVFEGFPGTTPPALRGRCPKCLQTGHGIRQCKNLAAAQMFDCCKFYGRHRFECPNNPDNAKATAPPEGKVNYFSASLEGEADQPNLADEELYPVEVEVGDLECDEELSEEEYSSSEDETGEVYLGPRASKGRRLEKLPPLPRQPLHQPLSAEQKAKRNRVRLSNRQEQLRKNTRVISLILKDAGPQLAAHKDYPHFRTDLHRYVDDLFQHERRNPPPAAAPAPLVGSATPVQAPVTSEPEPPAKRARTGAMAPAAAMHLKVDIDPGVDRTNYQTEVTLQVDDAQKRSHRVRAIVDSGATSSGINEKLVERLGLSDLIRPTSYTYRTAGGDVQRARGVIRITLRMGPISVKTYVLVMSRACNFSLLLGNEILTVLQADILRSKNQVRFQYASTVVYLPLLPREAKEGAEEIYRITSADVPDGWVNFAPPLISVPKNGLRAVARKRRRIVRH